MNNYIPVIKEAGKNIYTHYLLGNVKAKINPENIEKITGVGVAAVATAKILLESSENKAVINVQQDGRTQCTEFQYSNDALESAHSEYNYDDTENKRLCSQTYDIQDGKETSSRAVINYAEAEISDETKATIEKINSDIAQIRGYKSTNTEYDPQDSATYGAKTTSKKFPAIYNLLCSLFPNSDITKLGSIKVKEKLREKTDTTIVGFEGAELPLRGLVSIAGDNFAYYVDTPEMTVTGDMNGANSSYTAYLKSVHNEKIEDTTEETQTSVQKTQTSEQVEEETSSKDTNGLVKLAKLEKVAAYILNCIENNQSGTDMRQNSTFKAQTIKEALKYAGILSTNDGIRVLKLYHEGKTKKEIKQQMKTLGINVTNDEIDFVIAHQDKEFYKNNKTKAKSLSDEKTQPDETKPANPKSANLMKKYNEMMKREVDKLIKMIEEGYSAERIGNIPLTVFKYAHVIPSQFGREILTKGLSQEEVLKEYGYGEKEYNFLISHAESKYYMNATDKKASATDRQSLVPNKKLQKELEEKAEKEAEQYRILLNKRHAVPVYEKDYYIEQLKEALTLNESVDEKTKHYTEIIAFAYLDGYNTDDLYDILTIASNNRMSVKAMNNYIIKAKELAASDSMEAPTLRSDEPTAEEIINEHFENRQATDGIGVALTILFVEPDNYKKLKEYDILDSIQNELKAFFDNQYDSNIWETIKEKIKDTEDKDLLDVCELIDTEYKEEHCTNINNGLINEIEVLLQQIPQSYYQECTGYRNSLYAISSQIGTNSGIDIEATEQKISKLQALKQEVKEFINNILNKTQQTDNAENKEVVTTEQPKAYYELSAGNKDLIRTIINTERMPSLKLTQSMAENLLLDIGFTRRKQSGDHAEFISKFHFKNYLTKETSCRITFATGDKELDQKAKREIQDLCEQLYKKDI